MRKHDIEDMTDDELERDRRDLAASLALIRPDSPLCVTILTQLGDIEDEQAERAKPHLRLCSCGFATNGADWMDGHLSERPDHRELKAEPMSEAWTSARSTC